MKTAVIISEYNPFHSGHLFLCERLREKSPDVTIVSVMSGSWVQRGEPAIFSKSARAEAAVSCGIDLVLELPAPWSMAGAEFFARAGVHIADCIGADTLAFGSESGDLASLSLTVLRLASPEFAAAMGSARDEHPEWSTAKLRERVFAALFGESAHFSGSNDLLALEYLRAIKTLGAGIEPFTMRRVGSIYGSEEIGGIASATALRRVIREGGKYAAYVPIPAEEIFSREIAAGNIHALSSLDAYALGLFITRDASEFSGIMEIAGGMENRLAAAAKTCDTIESLIAAAKEQRYSESRLRRAIVSAMLDIRMRDADALPAFTQVLAANERGRALLAANRKNERIAILATPTAGRKLTGDAAAQYALSRRADRLWELTKIKKSSRSRENFQDT